MPRNFVSRWIIKGDDQSARAFASVEKSAARTIAKFAAFAGVGLSLDAVIGKTKEAIKQFDNIAKTADKIGVSTDALQELRHAAELNGVAINTADMALQRFVRRTAEAAEGTGEAKDVIEKLGLQLRDNDGRLRSADALLSDVADKLANVEDQGERVRIAFKLFDSEGVQFVNVLQNGSAELEKMRKEARDLGIVIDEQTLRSTEKLNDEMTRAQKIIDAQLNQALIELAPLIVDATKAFAGMAAEIVDLINAFKDLDEISISSLDRQIEALNKRMVLLRKSLSETHPEVVLLQRKIDKLNAEKVRRELIPVFEEWRPKVEAIRDIIGDIKFSRTFFEQLDSAVVEIGQVLGLIDRVEKKTQEAADEISLPAKPRPKPEDLGAARDKLEREKENFVAHLKGLEAEEVLHFERRRERLQEFKDQGLINDDEHFLLERELFRQHQDALTQITKDAAQDRADFEKAVLRQQINDFEDTSKAFLQIGAAIGGKQFEQSKGFRIAEALIHGAAGIARAFAEHHFPIPAIPVAAAVAAVTGAQVAAIASAQPGKAGRPSVGGASGGGGPRPNPVREAGLRPDPQRQRARGEFLIRIEGLPRSGLMPVENVRQLMEQISEASADGFNIRFSG